VRHLRVHGTTEKWSAKLVEDYDIDDKHHKQAVSNLIHDLKELAVVRDYYIDRDIMVKLYDQHMSYQQGEMK
jgi:hypothetical protein